MSERYKSGRIRYSYGKNKDKISVTFQDKFGKKFLSVVNLKQFFPQTILQKYKTRKKDGNKIQLKLRKQQNQIDSQKKREQQSNNCDSNQNKLAQNLYDYKSKIDHSEVIDWLQQALELDYCYFKSLPSNVHLVRNKKFQTICSQEVFRQLYPQIRCIIMIESQQQTIQKKQNIEFIDEKQQEQQKFSNGQLIIFIQRQKKHTIKEVVKYLQTYTSQKVIYPLDEYIQIHNLHKEGLSLNQITIILQKVVNFLRPQINTMAKSTRLLIKSINIYAPESKRQRYPNYQGRIGLQIKLQGMFQSLPQFYFNLCSFFKHHPITIGKVQNIQFSNDINQTQTQYRQQNVILFFGSYQSVGIINLKNNFTNWVEFKRSLRKGLHIISQLKGFTKEQMQILVKQHRQVQIFINDSQFIDFVNYQYKPIDQKSFFIKCEKQNVTKFINRAFDYLKKNQRFQTKRQQFTTQFQLFFFNKLIKTHIQQKYPTVSFFVKEGALYSRSRQQDLQDLKIQMLNQKRKFLKKIVRLPSVRAVKRSHLYEIIEDQFQTEKYCHQINTKTIHYSFDKSIDIYFRSLSSLSQSHQLLIPIIDQFYEQFEFFMQKFKENSLSLQKYQKHISGQNQGKFNLDRMILYSMTKSKYVGQMLVWFIDSDERGVIDNRKLRWDIGDFVDKYKSNNVLEFIIPQSMWKSERYFGIFFIQLLKQFYKQSGSNKTQTINVFYESDMTSSSYNKMLQILKKTFQKGQNSEFFKLKSQMRLTSQQIEKIIMTEGWSMSYWDNETQKNQNLSVLNSFVFAYQKSRRKDQFKVPLLLKPKQAINKYEYLLSLKQDIYYKILPNCYITKHQINQNPALIKFSNIIKTYFKFLQYLIVYMNDTETEVESKKMYFWLNTTTSVSNGKSLPGQQKIKRFQINQQEKLIPKKNSQVDIFVKRVDFIPKYIIQTHVDFLNQVKRLLPLNAIND